jgi:hypothetical protein
MQRGLLLAALVLLASSCGGGSKMTAGTTTGAVSADPHGEARGYLLQCRKAVNAAPIGAVARADLATARSLVAKAKAACGETKRMQAFAQAHMGDSGLTEASAAESALAAGLANFEKYLGHVAAGTNGKRIFSFSVEQIRQGKLLLEEALVELK